MCLVAYRTLNRYLFVVALSTVLTLPAWGQLAVSANSRTMSRSVADRRGDIANRPTHKMPMEPGKRPLHLTLENQPLAMFLHEIQKQTGIIAIADDSPFVTHADLVFSGTLEQGLERITSLFDYDWSISPHGVIVMHKCFHNQADYPHLGLVEMKAIANDACQVLDNEAFVPGIIGSWEFRIRLLYHSLSPDQIQMLLQGQPLFGESLNPIQMHFLRQAAYNASFHDLTEAWRDLADSLEALPRSTLRSTAVPDTNFHALSLIYRDKSGADKQRDLTYLSQLEVKTKP